jgi:hypothetical protein
MNRKLWVSALVAILAAIGVSGCAEQAGPRLRIDPRADAALRKMSATLGEAKSFRFQSATTMDEPVETGHLAQFSRGSQVAVHRPDKVYIRTEMGNDIWTLWYQIGRASCRERV